MDVQGDMLRINFELGPKDIEYFRNRLSKARKNRALRDDDRVILAAEALASKRWKAIHQPSSCHAC